MAKADAADLVQEVYLRMLRVSDPEAIRNPESYLFTVAANLHKENAVADRRQAQEISVDTAKPTPPRTKNRHQPSCDTQLSMRTLSGASFRKDILGK
jgi:DNA-directed RNA polymerase specialized sigma24 family protein